MKNGLVLLLLMVVLVAMTATAGAIAPVIKDIPAIVIGDAEDIAGPATTDAHLLRYVNAVNLSSADVIERKTNPDDATKLHVWYTTTGSLTLKASNATALVAPMTAAEATALTDLGTQPTGKQINTTTDFWLSLIEDAPGTGKVSAASATAATAAANGNTTAGLTAAGAVGKRSVKLYAIDVDGVTTAVGKSTQNNGAGFDVYSVLGMPDGLSGRTNILNNTFTNANGWFQIPGTGTVAGDFQSPAGAIGFTGKAALNAAGYNYGSWATELTGLTAGTAGMVFEVKASLTGSATAAVNTPGHRLLAYQAFGMHASAVQVLTQPGMDQTSVGNAAARNGQARELRMYFANPSNLPDMSDTGYLNKSVVAANDLRDYILQFEMIQEETADGGNNILMTDLNIDLIPRPASVTPAIKWGTGTGAIAMNSTTAGSEGFIAQATTVSGLGVGNAAIDADSIDFTMGTANNAYKAVAPPGLATALPAWAPSKLVRTKYVVSCSGIRGIDTRFLTMGIGSGFGAYAIVTQLTYSGVATKYAPSTAHPRLAGTPTSTGSDIDVYAYTHYGLTGGKLFPQFDIVQADGSLAAGATSTNWNGWGKPSGMSIKEITMEVLNP